MFFNEIMALIMPSIVALLFFSRVIRRKITFFDGLCYLVLFMLLTNWICYSILIYVNKTLAFVFSNSFSLKYSIMATGVALVVATLYRFLELNIRISLKVESKDEEK